MSHQDLLSPPLAERTRAFSGRVAVVGAGISGLLCTRALADAGHDVLLFDKARGPGGRIASRRKGDLRLDHGAQYFTIRDWRVLPLLRSWIDHGIVAEWEGRIGLASGGRFEDRGQSEERYVGTPRMSALSRYLSDGLEACWECRISAITKGSGSWSLNDDEGKRHGDYDALVLALPAPQAHHLLLPTGSKLIPEVARVGMDPCWAIMALFDENIDTPYDGLFIKDEILAWAARNNSKPNRADSEAWVLHAGPEWTRRNINQTSDTIATEMLAAFSNALGTTVPTPSETLAHRWRYARVSKSAETNREALWDVENRVAVCGDWCLGGRVEGAILSGMAAARFILRDATLK